MALISFLFGLLTAVVFFGGHGRQFISPAAVGWSFALLSFPSAFGFGWSYPFSSPLMGFTRWSAMVPTIDDPVTLFSLPDRISNFIQPILSGSFPQPPANTLPLLTLIIGLILLILKVSDIRTALSFIITYAAVQALLLVIAPESTPNPTVHLIGLPIFTAFFLLPDNRTCARTFAGRWLSGAIAGISGVLILNYSSFPGGIIFSVLLANVFNAILDEGVLSLKYRSTHERS
jgi:electron transport complex protein RnfD